MPSFLPALPDHAAATAKIDGAWARGYDVDIMEVFGLPNDVGWGPWAVESGWTVAEITAGLYSRHPERQIKGVLPMNTGNCRLPLRCPRTNCASGLAQLCEYTRAFASARRICGCTARRGRTLYRRAATCQTRCGWNTVTAPCSFSAPFRYLKTPQTAPALRRNARRCSEHDGVMLDCSRNGVLRPGSMP